MKCFFDEQASAGSFTLRGDSCVVVVVVAVIVVVVIHRILEPDQAAFAFRG